MDCIIFDVDGTLADVSHRLHHVQKQPKNWDAFFDGIPDDPPHEAVVRLAGLVHNGGMRVILCSGRPERCRANTIEWMHRHGVRFEALYMRADDDKRPDHVVKLQILSGIREDGYNPIFTVDDRQSVVDMWRAEGLTCLQARVDDDVHYDKRGKLTIMVGPSGAGKSTWLQNMGVPSRLILSSDDIREDLCGNRLDQTRNDEVFAALNAQAKARIGHGLDTVIDATHLRRKDRLLSASLARGGPVRYVVIDRPMEEKRRDGGWRNELNFDLLEKHAQTFRSQINDILRGDDLPNVEVLDVRS